MLIVSKFHDYYDTASIYGIDKTCVYLRSELKIPLTWRSYHREYILDLPNGKHWEVPRTCQEETIHTDSHYTFDKWVVGFCGHLYPMVKVSKRPNSGAAPQSETFLYSKEDVQQYLAKEEIATKKSKYRYWSYYGDFSVQSEKGMSNFFDLNSWKKFEEVFVAFRTPVFLVKHQSVVLNPNLKSLGFMKIKDSPSAFQDIYMYLSGVLIEPPKPTKPIDDKTMAASKGHDGEYSFKKPPGKKVKWR